MKTKEELDAIKEEIASLNKKLSELSEEELKEVTGGVNAEDHNVILSDVVNDNTEKWYFEGKD